MEASEIENLQPHTNCAYRLPQGKDMNILEVTHLINTTSAAIKHTSTCAKDGQNMDICIYIVSSSELARPSGRYTTSLGASKRF